MKELTRDIIELTRAYLGTILIFIVGCYQSSRIPGIFGEQVNIILRVCSQGSLMCPFNSVSFLG